MNVKEILLDMINRQKRLDIAMYGSNNAEYKEENTRLALIDEIGELNHELKADWCWWKKTQKPVDREKVLGELADVAHFCLNIYYHEYPDRSIEWLKDAGYKASKRAKDMAEVSYFYRKLTDPYSDHAILENLLGLTFKLGFTLEELYEAYKTKNEINYRRIEQGY